MRTIKRILGCVLAAVLFICLPFSAAAAESDLTAAYLMKNVPEPACGSVGGEWTVIGLAGCPGGVPQQYLTRYFRNLEAAVKESGGIAPSVIEDALGEIDDVAVRKKLSALMSSKWKSLERESDPFKRKAKLFRYAVGRGYDYEQIKEEYDNIRGN